MGMRAGNDFAMEAYRASRARGVTIKQQATSRAAEIRASGIRADRVVALWRQLLQQRAELTRWAATPNINTFAKEWESDLTYDFVTDVGNVVSAIDAAITWIAGAVPRDGNNRPLLMDDVDAQAEFVWRNFTPAQAEPLAVQLDNIAAAITLT